jgi:serine/threonine protein kinase/WD40 repeat protein
MPESTAADNQAHLPAQAAEPTVDRGATLPPPTGAAPTLALPLAPPEEPGELGRLAHYRILKLLGQGGMGAVFQAEDTHLCRPVALKVMLPAYADDRAARERFLREARAAAAIKHDHIVTIYQVGEGNGVPFLAMEFLRGAPLDRWLEKYPRPTVSQILRLGREVAAGLAAAHAKGLIHRDIKPGNVWLEAPAGRVKILDFGLARSQKDVQITQSGLILGTPAYMSPEQARGQTVDHRSDLWSLGVLLYRLATGKLPFAGTDMISTLTAIALEEPPPVLDLNPDLPPALVGLIERLLTKDPPGRPQSADEVVRELKAIGRGANPAERTAITTDGKGGKEPSSRTLRQEPPPVPTRQRRWPPPRSRWKSRLAVGTAALVVIAAGVFVATRSKRNAEPLPKTVTVDNPAAAVVPLPPANGAARDLLALVDPAKDALGGTWEKRPEGLTGRIEGDKVAKLQIPYRPPAEYDLRVEFTRTGSNHEVMVSLSHGGHSFRWTMDMRGGQYLFQNMGVRPAENPSIVNHGKLTNNRRHMTVVRVRNAGADAELDGKPITSYRGDYADLRSWVAFRLKDESLLGLLVHEGPVVFHTVEVTDVTGTGGVLRPPPADMPVAVRKLHGHSNAVTAVAVLPDGKRGLSAGRDKTIRLWDLTTGAALQTWHGHQGPITALAVSHDGKHAVAGGPADLRLWDVDAGRELAAFGPPDSPVQSLAFAPITRTFLSGDEAGRITRWNIESKTKTREFKADGAGPVLSLAVAPGNRVFLSGHGGANPAVLLWEGGAGAPARRFTGIGRGVTGLAVLPDGKRFVAAGLDGSIHVWEMTGQEVPVIMAGRADRDTQVCSLALTPDGKRAVVGTSDRKLRLYDLETGRQVSWADVGSMACYRVAVSPDGKWALTGGGGRMDGDKWQADGDFALRWWKLP